jgi:hypothetical protein
MFTFGSLGYSLVDFQIFTVLSLLAALFLAIALKKTFEINLISTVIFFCLIATILTIYAFNVNKSYFYSLKILDDNHIELKFDFPDEHVKILSLNQINDVKFGMVGKTPNNCYINIYAQDGIYTSQTDKDCEKVKSLARKLKSDIT